MKKFSPAFVLIVSFVILFFSCKKINEATILGGDLIPPVDNVNTFEVALTANTVNGLLTDSTRVGYNDQVALGDVADPEFGQVHANFCFRLTPTSPNGVYPFLSRPDSLPAIDSVVLSLAYTGAYGDTLGNGVQTVTVYDIDPGASFRSDTSYRYNDPSSDFSGTSLGTKTYTIKNLKDTSSIKEPGDTGSKVTKLVNVLRIRLNTSLGTKIADFDTASGSPNAGFYSDSAFNKLFPGLAVKSANSGNALAYFNLADTRNTKLVIYYRYKKNGQDTTAAVTLVHSGFGQSNYINVQPGGNWMAALGNPNSDKIYIEGAPSGAYASIVIPDLSTLGNKVIHRAEIIAPRVPSAGENQYAPPSRLFLDHTNKGTPDTAFIFPKDIVIGFDGTIDFSTFGGDLHSDMYRFNITRYVQGIVTRHEPNDTLRLYAPFRPVVFNPDYITQVTPRGGYQVLPIGRRIMEGRVVLGGGNYADPSKRLRLRIVYSNL